MRKRVKWTYVANFDYFGKADKDEWVIGFLNEEGSPYECPRTKDSKLIEKLKELVGTDPSKKLKVTVEINYKPDKWGSEYPILVDVCEP